MLHLLLVTKGEVWGSVIYFYSISSDLRCRVTIKVSFVTVTFNNSGGLEKTLKSYVSLQAILGSNDSEIVVVDGASTDRTVEVLDKFDEFLDVVISEPDNGIYDAMNKGVLNCSGEFVNFMNAGDYILSDGMKKLIERCESTNEIYVGEASWNGEEPFAFPMRSFRPWWLKMPNHQTMIVPRKFLLDNPFSEDLPINADLDNKIKAYLSGLEYTFVSSVVVSSELGGISQSYKTFFSAYIRGAFAYKVGVKNFGVLCGFVNFFKTFLWGIVKVLIYKIFK